jgi:hypothetical protein
VRIPIHGQVPELAWAQAVPLLEGVAGSGSTELQRQLLGSIARCGGPVVLRGAAAGWPALRRWDLGHLAAQDFRGRVKAAPSLHFPFCEPQLLRYLRATERAGGGRQAGGGTAAPSVEVAMGVGEFAARLRRGCRLPRVAYQPREFYYMQAELVGALAGDVPVQRWLQQLQQLLLQQQQQPPRGAGGASGPAPPVQLAQAARVWVSPQGAVSPLHFDADVSFLAQLRGTKRMLLVHPDQLECLYPYPGTHLLRRRSRVNVAQPDSARWPLFARVSSLEVVLSPGDVLFFPQQWAHYTESLELSVSVTFRVEGMVPP